MVPGRWIRTRQYSAGPLCGRHGIARANGTRGAGGMDATAGSVQCSSPDRESGKESADDAGRRFAFLGFEFRKAAGRRLYMWPREKACVNIRHGVGEVVGLF